MCNTRQLAVLLFLLTFLAAGWFGSSARAQRRFDIELPRKGFEIEAFVQPGQPFGVGRISFELPQEMLPEPLGVEGIGISEKDGRVLYPAVDNPAFVKRMKELLESNTPLTTGGPVREQVGGLLREILDRPPRITLFFLFRDTKPLDLSLEARTVIPLGTLRPRSDPAAYRRLFEQWWKQYAKPAGLFEPKPDYPPVIDNYLMTTLARRLNLRLPQEKQTKSAYAELRDEVGLNLGTESLRMAMQQDRILGLNNLGMTADQPLPPPPALPELQVPDPAADVQVEPIAMHVPAECFYVRFGSFANFLWLQDTLAKWGGDAQNLIALRGLDRGMSSHIEKQLVMKQTVLSRMLGDTVIADVAFIGADMFFREGASYGLLFHARNNFGLSTSIGQQRSERMGAGGVKEEKLKIADHDVSYLSSPNGAVRSYYVVDGDFHFIATSKSLVARFLAASSGEGALGASKEFRHARSVMPISREDTVWVYLSDAFFRNMTGPHYRVEMARRLQAVADVELVQLAKLTAACEGVPGGTIEQLMAAGFVPPEFGPLPGGSRTVLDGGEVYDSVRGHSGAFLPVGDVPVGLITAAELAEFNRFTESYRTRWGRMDPVIVGIKRNAQKDNREQVVVDALMSPFAPQHFNVLKQWLGPADEQALAPIPGDMAALELAMPAQHIFGGLRDIGAPSTTGVMSWLPVGRLRDIFVGYVGTTGELGLLGILNIGIPPQSDTAGFAGSPLGGWRRQFGPFTAFSFQHDVLETVMPQLRYQQAQRPAQIRLRVDDVSHARITPTLNDLGYARTRETSLNNLRFLHTLDEQLHVPPKACREAAEFLLDAKLICPLGGQYELRETDREPAHWTSTALNHTEPGGFLRVHAPKDYQSPPLSWFRGLDLDATMTEKNVSAHAEVIMQMPAK